MRISVPVGACNLHRKLVLGVGRPSWGLYDHSAARLRARQRRSTFSLIYIATAHFEELKGPEVLGRWGQTLLGSGADWRMRE